MLSASCHPCAVNGGTQMIELACGHQISEGHESTHYCRIMGLETLLRLQPSGQQSCHPDHHFFILVHQVMELWLRQIVVDLYGLIEALDGDDVGRSVWLTQRMGRVTSLLTPATMLMESIPPSDFLVFRDHYGSTSGGDSIQFREIEILAGVRDPAYRRFLEAAAGNDATGALVRWTDRLRECWEGRTVDQAFNDLLRRQGLAIADLYTTAPARNHHFALFSLAEALLDFDEQFLCWRIAHARVAERAIGPIAKGSGYTVGVRYLDATVNRRFFPGLWESRTTLIQRRAQERR
jgi:tryptophan 2,3-dioxygenase